MNPYFLLWVKIVLVVLFILGMCWAVHNDHNFTAFGFFLMAIGTAESKGLG